ncbi:GNAT family N-acetyltransferase [Streptomyces alkaliterrae]|uniref:GNAT family N-acetyltransferase n=1 Tax=Streptomyces alkaliterrae TaxID=2213162 RepID=UPI001E4B9FD1|nr:GNAT family N-acetyltransferase [Streptomyces alkaliterrae]
MTEPGISLIHETDADRVWSTLIELYAEVWSGRLHEAHYSVERYGERLARHGAEEGWEAVIAYREAEPIGYVYLNRLRASSSWWSRTTPRPTAAQMNASTIVLREGMLRRPWRSKGIARRVHDEILSGRREQQVTLLVNPGAGNGKLKALYESWGYTFIGAQQPAVDGPQLAALLRPTRLPSTPG